MSEEFEVGERSALLLGAAALLSIVFQKRRSPLAAMVMFLTGVALLRGGASWLGSLAEPTRGQPGVIPASQS